MSSGRLYVRGRIRWRSQSKHLPKFCSMVLPTDADGTEVNLTGTWMTIEIEIEREVMQQNADNVYVRTVQTMYV